VLLRVGHDLNPPPQHHQGHARHQLDAVEHGVQRGADRVRGAPLLVLPLVVVLLVPLLLVEVVEVVAVLLLRE